MRRNIKSVSLLEQENKISYIPQLKKWCAARYESMYIQEMYGVLLLGEQTSKFGVGCAESLEDFERYLEGLKKK